MEASCIADFRCSECGTAPEIQEYWWICSCGLKKYYFQPETGTLHDCTVESWGTITTPEGNTYNLIDEPFMHKQNNRDLTG